jgi:hypothetical protein
MNVEYETQVFKHITLANNNLPTPSSNQFHVIKDNRQQHKRIDEERIAMVAKMSYTSSFHIKGRRRMECWYQVILVFNHNAIIASSQPMLGN